MTRASLSALLAALALTGLLAACGKPADDKNGKTDAKSEAPLIVSAEDVQTLGLSDYASGPVITGSIQPAKRADLRAELQAVVLQVLKENGEKVRHGDLLVLLDDSAIRENLSSAQEAARAAAQSFEQAERQYQRLKTLQAQGMSSIQATEDAELRRNNAQSDLLAAKSRVATANQQRQRTEVRAPFDGVLSDRKVSPGDTAQLGKELVKVIDPSSMRFEGLVSADRMAELKLGQPVFFRVNGYAQTDFQGKVRRIAVAANSSTRQVEVLVDFAGEQAPAVAGLYAEGRVQSQSVNALMLAEAAIQREGDAAFAWRLQNGKLNKVGIKLGERDARLGLYQVVSGLTQGDQLLRRPGSGLSDGRKFELAKVASAAVSAAPASAAAAASSAGG